MAGGRQPRTNDKPSIKYRSNPTEGAFFELVDFDRKSYAPTSSDSYEHNRKNSESNSSEILSTTELISGVCHVWDRATRPLSVFLPKTNSIHNNSDLQKEKIFCYTTEYGNDRSCTSAESQCFSVGSTNTSHSSPMVQGNLEFLKVTQKMSFLEIRGGSDPYSFFGRFLQGNMPNESWKGMGLASVGISCNLESMYGWMSEITLARLNHQANSIPIENKKAGDCCISGDTSSPASCCVPGNTASSRNDLITENDGFHTEISKPRNSSSAENAKSIMNTRICMASLYSDYYLGPVQVIEANDSASKTPSSRLLADYHVNFLASASVAREESEQKTEDDHHGSEKNQQEQFVIEDESKVETCSPSQDKPHYALAKQEHAFAGAMAGIFVSLSLHPVDTIKTLVQSCRTDQKSIHYIGRSIICERGISGLYRGITSNIASSAPISALYTFTYESVKGALLPLFPKEYQSLAHCMAGGCASIATSFIFTPSEHIKQQMQVGSHYRNCWNALIRIIAKGGLPSLYAGWGAVLCRNVPHSIIKFYTYESLKQVMLSSLQLNSQPNTLLTLVCGGLAGSTAALFTTPFDVVKTRLQTQIPGSIKKYDGVFNTLKEIGKLEGLKGLYRGLTPRLVMYMTQGALFFASYESFKRLFSLEVPQLNAEVISNEEDGSQLSPPQPRLHNLHS